MEVRYVGTNEEGVDLTDPQVHLDRLEWVDLPAELARSLAKGGDFELDVTKKKTKAAPAADDTPSGKEG